MEAKRWAQVEELYHASLRVATGQRAAFLRNACGQDEDLRCEVESLLAHEKSAGGFIEAPAFELAAKLMAHDKAVGADVDGIPDPGSSRDGLYLLDLSARKISKLPGFEGMHYANWSPDGHCLAATGQKPPSLLDLQNRRWTPLGDDIADWAWSHDGQYLYEDRGEAGIFRLHISDWKLEKIADTKDVRRAVGRQGGTWFGLTPDDTPMLLRNLSSQQIYALDWKTH